MSPSHDVDAAVALLADGPMDDLELLVALGADDAAADVLGLLRALRDDGRIVLLPDGRAALRATLVDGLVLWHRVGAREAEDRAIELGAAVAPLAGVVRDTGSVVVGDEEVAMVAPLADDGEPDVDRGPLVVVPSAWRPDLAAGDLVGVVVSDRRLELVDEVPVAAAEDVTTSAESRLVEAVRTIADERALAVLDASTDLTDGRDDEDAERALIEAGRWALRLDDVGSDLLVDHGAALRALARPLAEVLVDAGWRVVDETVLGAEVDDETWAVHSLGRELVLEVFPTHDLETGEAEACGMAWGALRSEAPPGEVVGWLLADPLVAEVIAAHAETLDDDELDRLLPGLDALAAGGDPGPSLVLCRVLLVRGRVVEAKDLAERAFVVGDEDWDAGVEVLALLRAVAGDVAGAISAYRSAGGDGVERLLQEWRPVPPAGVGRNEACPCGSGRKFKQCCLRTPPPLPIDARVSFVWWKLQITAVELFGDELPHLDDPRPDRALGMVVVDGFLVEGGGISDVGGLLGPLLPDDERALLDAWGAPTRTVFEVEGRDGDALVLRDLLHGERRTVGLDAVAHAADGDTIVAVAVPAPSGGDHLVGPVVHVPVDARDDVVAALDAGLDAQQVVDLVVELLASTADAHLH